MLNSLCRLFRKASSARPPESPARPESTLGISSSADGTKLYRSLEVTASSYAWDTLSAEQLSYWVKRLHCLGTPFLTIIKPRPGVMHPEFLQTYWESGQDFQFEWWNFSQPGLHRVCLLHSADHVIDLMLGWLDGDNSQLDQQDWELKFFEFNQ